MDTAAPEATRYAINTVQFRGSTGQIAATVGRQLLVQSGYCFPWDDDLLLPRTTLFAAKELPRGQNVLVGRAGERLCVRVGCWTFHLAVQKDGRFPNVTDHIGRIEDATARGARELARTANVPDILRKTSRAPCGGGSAFLRFSMVLSPKFGLDCSQVSPGGPAKLLGLLRDNC